MDFNLTGFLWGWPYNLTGQATGQESVISWPELSANISNFNIFSFSGEATANLTLISIIAVISIAVIISIIIFPFFIKNMNKATLSHSGQLCSKYSNNQERMSVYSRLCGQRILTYNYNRSYWGSLSSGDFKIRYPEELFEKIIASNKDLMELIGSASVLFPGAVKKTTVDEFGEKTKNILWIRTILQNAKQSNARSSDSFEIIGDKSSDIKSSIDSFEKVDNILPELKEAINELDEDIKDLLIAMENQITAENKIGMDKQ